MNTGTITLYLATSVDGFIAAGTGPSTGLRNSTLRPRPLATRAITSETGIEAHLTLVQSTTPGGGIVELRDGIEA